MLIFKWIPQSVYKKMVMIAGEIIGTAMLLFLGCSGIAHIDGIPPALGSPLNFGLTVMMIVQIFGHLSFAILNPAVAVAAVVNNLISWQMGIAYIVSECIGACIGYGLLYLLTPNDVFCLGSVDGMCLTQINKSLSVTQGFFIEFFATCTLVAVTCSVWDKRTPNDSAPIKVGLTIVTLSIAFGVYSGASMNPARSFAPALFNSNWENHWVYWASPISAGLITSLGYKIFFMHDFDEK